MEGFVGEKDFELAAVWSEDPMEVLEDRGHVSMGVGEVMGPGGWDFLMFIEGFWWWNMENAVTEADAGCVNQGFRKWIAETATFLRWK